MRDDREWQAFASAIAHPELAGDGRFATNESRRAHHDELDGIIGDWVAARDVTDAFHGLQGAGIAAAPLLDDSGFVGDPQVKARGWLRPLLSHDVGIHDHPGLPYRGLPEVWWRGSPVLGEDNEYVYRKLLGVSETDFERYRQEHILADDYLDPTGEPY